METHIVLQDGFASGARRPPSGDLGARAARGAAAAVRGLAALTTSALMLGLALPPADLGVVTQGLRSGLSHTAVAELAQVRPSQG